MKRISQISLASKLTFSAILLLASCIIARKDILKTLILFLLFSSASFADTISMRTDEWCPYACDPKSSKPGFIVEIVKEIFRKHGNTIEYEVMNWARAVSDVKMGKFDGLIGCSKADVEGFVIPKNTAGVMMSYFYTLKDDTWIYTGEKSLDGKKIGVINDYTHGDEIDRLVNQKNKAFLKASGENPLLRLIQMTEKKG